MRLACDILGMIELQHSRSHPREANQKMADIPEPVRKIMWRTSLNLGCFPWKENEESSPTSFP